MSIITKVYANFEDKIKDASLRVPFNSLVSHREKND